MFDAIVSVLRGAGGLNRQIKSANYAAASVAALTDISHDKFMAVTRLSDSRAVG